MQMGGLFGETRVRSITHRPKVNVPQMPAEVIMNTKQLVPRRLRILMFL